MWSNTVSSVWYIYAYEDLISEYPDFLPLIIFFICCTIFKQKRVGVQRILVGYFIKLDSLSTVFLHSLYNLKDKRPKPHSPWLFHPWTWISCVRWRFICVKTCPSFCSFPATWAPTPAIILKLWVEGKLKLLVVPMAKVPDYSPRFTCTTDLTHLEEKVLASCILRSSFPIAFRRTQLTYFLLQCINFSYLWLSFQAWPAFLCLFLTRAAVISTFLLARQFLCMVVNWTILNHWPKCSCAQMNFS